MSFESRQPRVSAHLDILTACCGAGVIVARCFLLRHRETSVIRRYTLVALYALAAQYLVVRIIRRHESSIDVASDIDFFSAADGVTLCRGAVGAHILGLTAASFRDRKALAGPVCWAPLLTAVTVADWADGWCARHIGPRQMWGAAFDLETDSWLTLCSACAGVRIGDLPRYVVVAPLLRHAVFWYALARGTQAPVRHRGAWWERGAGAAQMTVLLAALTTRGFPGKCLLHRIAGPISLLSLGSFLLQWGPHLMARQKHGER